MNGKILLAALAAVMLLAFATPVFAECGPGPVAYGAPQDCVATVSCNIPVTQEVPYITSTVVPQPVTYPVAVPVESSVTVPVAVLVPQEVPVTSVAISSVTTSVPVEVPVTAYQPVTSFVPQTYTIPLESCGAAAPAGGISKGGANAGLPKAPAKGVGKLGK